MVNDDAKVTVTAAFAAGLLEGLELNLAVLLDGFFVERDVGFLVGPDGLIEGFIVERADGLFVGRDVS